ncbi:nitroreductase family protein [Clostridium formicaceticum]|uniref:Nitroreductase n=1 Tax=Clostridium formicaceticum TaxID=1497 RepID=A0AAC9RPM8_9CLOT|nr:nitroreductase family protein [Clostridium formicaceticum]AOY74960.1 nitroreductase [Clostridium formicaceticum]ARE89372.1 Nitroreductase family protein [Clostridium formicaceticum]
MSKDFYTSVKDRRSIYGIDKETVVSDERILEVIQHAVEHTPSAFNSQSGRVVLLLGKAHDQLWDITKKILKEIVPEENYPQTEEKINSFRNGYGSVLFFEDQNIVAGLQEKFPAYQENFPIWSQQASGMLQYVVWTSLEIEGFGASLQHYNPLIDDEVRKTWNIPSHWKLIAQLPFGKPTAAAGDKEIQPLEERVKVFK